MAMTVIVTVMSVVTVRPQSPTRPMHAVAKAWKGRCVSVMSVMTVKYTTYLMRRSSNPLRKQDITNAHLISSPCDAD